MDAEILKTVGQFAGIGGLGIGIFLLLFRDIVRKTIFPKLPAAKAYRLLRLITGAVWSAAIVGNATWIYIETRGGVPAPASRPAGSMYPSWPTSPSTAPSRPRSPTRDSQVPGRLPGDPTTRP